MHFFEQHDAEIAVPAPGWERNRIAFIAQPVDYDNRQLFSDLDPLPAVREIMQEGHARLQRP